MSPRPEPLRIVHLINHLGRGGSERQLYLLLRHFDRRRFRHRVVVFNESANAVYDEPLRALGVEVEALPPECRGVARRLLYLGRRLRVFRPHVVHSWTVHDNPYAGLLGRALGAARWGSLRGSLHSEGLARLSRPMRYLVLRSVERIVVNCRALARELEAAGVSPSRVTVLPNAVEIDAASNGATPTGAAPADLAEFGIDPADPVVGTVGNLRRVKNHKLFVRAMAEVLPRQERARALIVGQPLMSEPEYAAYLAAEIERLGLTGRVVSTGFRDDVPRILARLSVLCLASHSEGMPNAVLEAMAAGCPVVATRVGGVPELVREGENGHLVEPGDAAGMASAVAGLLEDPSRAAAMGENGRQRAARDHDGGRLAARLGELYEDAARGVSR